MSKKLLGILVLGLMFISSQSKADDISDFEIGGMSIGVSLLKYMNLNEIKKAEENSTFYKDNRYIVIFSNKSSQKYEEIEITYKPNDKNFLIHSLVGIIDYPDNYEKCKKDKSDIVAEVKELFKNSKIFEREAPHFHDKSKKSIVDQTDFYPEQGGFARISCTDWSKEFLTKHGWEDVLKVVIGSEEFNIFLRDEAYD